MTSDPILRWLALPVAASAHAGEIDHILSLVHWLMLLLFVGWTIFFMYVLVRSAPAPSPSSWAIPRVMTGCSCTGI